MDFTIEQHVDAGVDAVQAALLDPDFLEATAKIPRVGEPELLTQERTDGQVRQRVRYRFTGDLSSAVTRVVDPAKLTWVEDSVFDLEEHRSEHRIVPDYYGNRLQASYRGQISPNSSGSRRVVRGTLTVRVPLVGGRVERAIVDGLREHAVAEAALLDDWLGGRPRP